MRKQLLLDVLLFVLMAITISGCLAKEDTLRITAVKVNGKWGFIDKTGKMVIHPQFDGAGNFSEGLAAVKVDNKWGFVNDKGKLIIAAQFANEVDDFSEGLATIEIDSDNGKLDGYINKEGKIQIHPQFSNAHSFHEGLAAVCVGTKWGFCDIAGKIVIAPQYNYALSFSEGLAAVSTGGTLDEDGLLVGEKWGYIDKTGKMVIPAIFDDYVADIDSLSPINFTNGIAAARSGDKWGFIDKTGKFIIPAQFDIVHRFSDDIACVELRSIRPTTVNQIPVNMIVISQGYIERTGKYVITPKEDLCSSREYSEGLVPALSTEGDTEYLYGYLDKTSKFIIPAQYKSAKPFSDGLAAVRMEKKWGFIDKTGKMVIQPQFDSALSFPSTD